MSLRFCFLPRAIPAEYPCTAAGLHLVMLTSDFDFDLPRELIATRPAPQRELSRLLVLGRDSGVIQHRQFVELPQYLRAGDLLVLNDSRVIKARLRGRRRATGAEVEVLLLEKVEPSAGGSPAAVVPESHWRALGRPAKKFRVDEWIDFADGALPARVVAAGPDGERLLAFTQPDILPYLERHGELPLPPYIVQRRKETNAIFDDDDERYQTVYSAHFGSIAAPTAGLHFTPELLQMLADQGVHTAHVTLHVGAGTFKPVDVDNPADHPIHAETCEVPASTAAAITETRERGGRIIAVGTTTVRTLESAWVSDTATFRGGPFATRLLILPGYEFQVVDAMITNFHLPRSSLLMMVSAFAGHGPIMNAYATAIAQGYRFYSYGDAMLLTRELAAPA